MEEVREAYRILKLEFSNVFNLVGTQTIEPEPHMNGFCGEFGQGKTNILRTITSIFMGEGNIPTNLLRHGVPYGYIEMTVGDNQPRQIFKIEVEHDPKNPEIQRKPKFSVYLCDEQDFTKTKQTEINNLGVRLGITYLDILKMSPLNRLKEIMKIVPLDIDLAEHEAKRDRIYKDRTQSGRDKKNYLAQLKAFPEFPEDIPGSVVSTDELHRKQQEAFSVKSKIESMKNNLYSAQENINQIPQKIQRIEYDIKDVESKGGTSLRNNDKWLESEIDRIRSEHANRKREIEDHMIQRAEDLKSEKVQAENSREIYENEIITVEEKIHELSRENIDPGSFTDQFKELEVLNDLVRKKAEYDKIEMMLQASEEDWDSLTQKINDMDSEKVQAFRRAKLPEGVEIRTDDIYINGIPFPAASGFEQISTLVTLPLSTGAKFPLVLLDEADQIGGKAYPLIEALITDKGAQMFYTSRFLLSEGDKIVKEGKIIHGSPICDDDND